MVWGLGLWGLGSLSLLVYRIPKSDACGERVGVSHDLFAQVFLIYMQAWRASRHVCRAGFNIRTCLTCRVDAENHPKQVTHRCFKSQTGMGVKYEAKSTAALRGFAILDPHGI